jgi:ribosomal protein L37AE/L43A
VVRAGVPELARRTEIFRRRATVLGVSEACRTTEPCPQCEQADLRPYANGSKWICPRCYFVMPCCEGGELAAPAARRESAR